MLKFLFGFFDAATSSPPPPPPYPQPVNSMLEAVGEDHTMRLQSQLVSQILGVTPKSLQQAMDIAGVKMVRK